MRYSPPESCSRFDNKTTVYASKVANEVMPTSCGGVKASFCPSYAPLIRDRANYVLWHKPVRSVIVH
jgi:hypothetical protein